MTWRRAWTIGSMTFALACRDDGVSASDTRESMTSETSESGEGSGEDTSDGESMGVPLPDVPDESQPNVPIYDGEPLPAAPPGEWSWIDFPAATCIDGSPAGIGVRYGVSDELVIFFEGGGGCFNAATCGLYYASFAHFDQLIFDLFWQDTILQSGIFSTSAADNPVRDWNFVYVPYCTGDVHAGAAPNTPVPGFAFGQPQQFVGYTNVQHFLDRIVPTFADTSHVLVTGISAGGFGAAFNYDRIADAFAPGKVTLLDDSGPPLTDPWLVPCLQSTWRELFNLDATLPPGCAQCFQDDGGGIYNMGHYLSQKHADQTLGLISAEQDLTIRTFFGYGIQGMGGQHCPGGVFELPMSGTYFRDGLYSLRTQMSVHPNWGTYLIDGSAHTSLSLPTYYLRTVNGVRMVDWIADMLAGQRSHVSP